MRVNHENGNVEIGETIRIGWDAKDMHLMKDGDE